MGSIRQTSERLTPRRRVNGVEAEFKTHREPVEMEIRWELPITRRFHISSGDTLGAHGESVSLAWRLRYTAFPGNLLVNFHRGHGASQPRKRLTRNFAAFLATLETACFLTYCLKSCFLRLVRLKPAQTRALRLSDERSSPSLPAATSGSKPGYRFTGLHVTLWYTPRNPYFLPCYAWLSINDLGREQRYARNLTLGISCVIISLALAKLSLIEIQRLVFEASEVRDIQKKKKKKNRLDKWNFLFRKIAVLKLYFGLENEQLKWRMNVYLEEISDIQREIFIRNR